MKGNKLIDDHVQISVNLLRMKSHGLHFEVAVDPDKAVAFKEGNNVEVDEIVSSEQVFADMKKGLPAKESDLQTVFGTTDTKNILKIMLEKGELQFTQKYRHELREQKYNKIVHLIHLNAINPKTHLPHPVTRIKSAMEEAKVKIDDLRRAEDQVKDIVVKLRPVIPISIETLHLEIHVPALYAAKLYGQISAYGKTSKEQWLNDGSLSVTVEIPAGLREHVISELGGASHGSVLIKVK